jgi:hypothetical protein
MPGNENLITFQGEQGNLTRSPYEFKPRGRSGKFISDLLPNLAELADEMCFIHSMTAKSNTHGPAENQMSTGFTLDGFPSMGAWVSYALGTESQDLPAFVAIPDPRGVPQTGPNNWWDDVRSSLQGTAFNADKPIPNLATPKEITSAAEISTRDFLKILNDQHLKKYPGDSDLQRGSRAMKLAARMQLRAVEVGNLANGVKPQKSCTASTTRTKSTLALPATACSRAACWSAVCASSNCSMAPMRWAKAWATGTATKRSRRSTMFTGPFWISLAPH